MQFEYRDEVIDIYDQEKIVEALRAKDFIKMTNGTVDVYTVKDLYLRFVGDMDTMDAREILLHLEEDDDIDIEGQAKARVEQALSNHKIEVEVGDYEPLDLMRSSKDSFYRVVEEKFQGRYDITEVDFEFRGDLHSDGYMKVVAMIDKFTRNN